MLVVLIDLNLLMKKDIVFVYTNKVNDEDQLNHMDENNFEDLIEFFQ
jgi:hypothetical protein